MTTVLPPLSRRAQPVQPAARCLFHDGITTLDLLLAEIGAGEPELFDAALDLRLLFAARADAAACVRQLFRVRALLEARHYLAFYRVRCCARRMLRIEARGDGLSPWRELAFPLDGARMDEVVNSALADVSSGDEDMPTTAQVRFVFARTN